MSYMIFCNFNSKSDGRLYDFFFHIITALPFPLQNLVQRLPDSFECFFDPQRSFGNPLRTFGQYLASPVLNKSRFFSATAKFFSLIRGDL